MKSEKEQRGHNGTVEIRELKDGSKVITGYAIVFNSESQDLGGFRETIDPKAMQGADMSDVVAMFNHDTNLVLGRTPDTLNLTVDTKGVRYEIVPPDTQTGKDIMKSIERKDVRGSSFGFMIAENGDVWAEPEEKGGIWKRTINKFARIFDVSPVVYPAYEATNTSIAMRELGLLRDEKEKKETEQIELKKQKDKLTKDKNLKWMDESLSKMEDK